LVIGTDAPAPRPTGRASRHHALFGALAALSSLGTTTLFVNNWLQRGWLARAWLYRRPSGLLGLGVFASVSIASSLVLLALSRRGRWRSTRFAPLAWIPLATLAAWTTVWAVDPPALVYDAEWAAAAAAAAWTAGVALLAPRADRPWPAWARILHLAAFELAAVAVLGELGLRVCRSVAHPPLLATASTDPAAWVRTHQLVPGSFHDGFRVNREGYVDVEPEEAARHAHLVACIGDSFSVGVVPHHLHYTTIAEGCFDDLEVYNIGVVNAGPREYLQMLRASALPLRPQAIVIGIFVGNDILDAQRGESSELSTWMDRDEMLLLEVPRRLRALTQERRAGAPIAMRGSTRSPGSEIDEELSPAEAERRMPWLADPLLEIPPISAARFTFVEATRTEFLFPAKKKAYEPALAYLEEMREAAGSIPILCLILPDEYQVEDGLWERIGRERVLDGADRELPQKILSAWLDERGIPYVDLLPRMRAIPPLPDGNRHLYHLRDSHFNARGNRVAGEALAELIERAGVARRSERRSDGAPR
jgi:hypothetical protein